MAYQRYSTKANTDNSYHLQALVKTREFVLLSGNEIARRLDVSPNSFHDTISPKPKYFPSLPMIEDLLEIFEYEKPGAKLYYQLLILGLHPEQAEILAFKNPNQSRPTCVEDVQNMFLYQLKTEYSQFLADCILQKQIDLYDLITTECDVDTVASLFLACITKLHNEELANIILEQAEVPSEIATKLVLLGFALGADPEQVGLEVDFNLMGKVLHSLSKRIVTKSTTSKSKEKTKKESKVTKLSGKVIA